MSKQICVIGGGISGLCVAYRLMHAGRNVTLFEKSSAAGGSLKSVKQDGFLYEHGPNSALASRELLDLVTDLGLTDKIARTNPNARNRFIIRNGKLTELPSSISGLINSRAFSAKAKLRLLKEPFIPAGTASGESVARFFERRLGKEIVDYAVDPFISGIYAGDPQKLSIEHAFPRLFSLERNFGSLTIGALLSKKDKRARLPKGTPRSLTFQNGMQTLTDAIADKLGRSLLLENGVTGVRAASQGRFLVETDDGSEEFDAVVISPPSHSAARIVSIIDSRLAETLDSIYYAPVCVVVTAFRSHNVRIKPDGFGFLVPGRERRQILGSLWTSSVFENRAPDGYHIFTTFIGGSRNALICNLAESELVRVAVEELAAIMGVSGAPVLTAVKKWERAIPQYNIGYEKVIEAIEQFQQNNQGVFFCSNFYNGISVGDCVKNSIAVSSKVMDFLEAV